MYTKIARAIEYIRLNAASQPGLEEIAAQVNLSKYHFQRIFQEWVGVSPKTFLQYTTTEHAKKILLQGKSTLHTALDVGLSGNSRLHDHFVKIESVLPGQFKKRGEGMQISYQVLPSLFGNVLIAETEIGICRVEFIENDIKNVLMYLERIYPKAVYRNEAGRQGEAVYKFLSGFDKPSQRIVLDLRGTPFQLKVWEALLRIPFAGLKTYGEISSEIGMPKASRAVGTAIGNNPVAYLIPCHRVIRSTGEPGGYRWGETRKTALIAFESAHLLK
jgi:AraC family transcriptional regulator of adaptative response/methylated-DNA-[protein]-cysteine methyltransferase